MCLSSISFRVLVILCKKCHNGETYLTMGKTSLDGNWPRQWPACPSSHLCFFNDTVAWDLLNLHI